MDVNFEYTEPGRSLNVIESVSSEIPGGVMIRGAKIPLAFAFEGTPIVMDANGDYFPLSTDVNLSNVKLIGVLGETLGFFEKYNKEDRMCRVITVGVVNGLNWKQLASQPKYKNALTDEVEKMLAPAITFNPPVNIPSQGV